MPDTPAEFADRYLNLTVTTIPEDAAGVPGIAFVAARNYRNNDHRDTKGFGRGLHHFLVSAARSGFPGLTESGGVISYRGAGIPIQGRSLGEILHPFDGKGSPALFKDVLQLASLWLARDAHQRGLTPNLQAFADNYIGLDCIGFVHEYFLSEFPESAAARHSYIPAYRERGFHRRHTLGEVRPLDVILPATGNAHIALISSVSNRRRNAAGEITRIDCVIAQSAGEGVPGRPHNGIQYSPARPIESTPQEGVFRSQTAPPEWGGLNIYGVSGVPEQPVA